jgi:hypothetical protein
MKSKLPAIIGGIVGASLVAFLCGMILTVVVIMPAREPPVETAAITVEPTIGPHIGRTPAQRSPTPTYVVIILTPEVPEPTPTPTATVPGTTPMVPATTPTSGPSVTTTPAQRPTVVPSPTPTPRFPFYYVEGTRVEEEQCFSPHLQGFVRDSTGAALDGFVVRWQYWDRTEFASSGDPQKVWQAGEFKFTYGYGQAGFDPTIATDFVLQIVTSSENPEPLSEPLVIHYTGCFETGQITNIVFKRR